MIPYEKIFPFQLENYLKYILQMKNFKKAQQERLKSVQLKKTASVVKCFICNQMFYNQSAFDEHMKQHSSKLNKEVPEEIQRKTMESFRLKKNTIPTINKGSNTIDKKVFTQTATTLRPKVQQLPQSKVQEEEIQQSKAQIQEAEQALRQSTLLIQKIQALVHQQQNSEATPKKQQKNVSNITKQSIQQISQPQLIKACLQGEGISIPMIQSTKFSNQYLKSYRDQLEYLNQISSYIEERVADTKKIDGMKQSIVKEIEQYIRQNAIIKEQEDSNISGIYLTSNKQLTHSREAKDENMEIIENTEVCYCSQCYAEIEFGQDCYINKEDNTKQKYHIECWQQKFAKI